MVRAGSFFAAVLMVGCSGTGTLVQSDKGTPDDSGAATIDSGGGGSRDTGGDDSGGGLEPQPDYSVWQGSRVFSYDSYWDGYDCSGDDVGESGHELTGSDRDRLAVGCPACQHFYEVTPDSDHACDWIRLASPTWRGLVLGDGWAQVFAFDDEGVAELLDGAATFDGWTLDYHYTAEPYHNVEVDVVGQVTFPPVP